MILKFPTEHVTSRSIHVLKKKKKTLPLYLNWTKTWDTSVKEPFTLK